MMPGSVEQRSKDIGIKFKEASVPKAKAKPKSTKKKSTKKSTKKKTYRKGGY
jgi:hypothetical protein